MTRFWWVRHGPTHADGAVGWRDIPADLSDKAALKRLADHLPDDATVISSDLQRASATADAIQGARLRLPHDEALREMNYGDWDGLPFDEIAKTDPIASRQFWEEPGAAAPPNGESWDALTARIAAAVDVLVADHRGDIIVVAHFGVILSALQRAGRMDAKSVFSFKIDNLSVTRLDYLHDTKAWRVEGVNHRP